MQTKNIKIIENIPTKSGLDLLVDMYKTKNPQQIGWAQQTDGRFYLEVLLGTDRTA